MLQFDLDIGDDQHNTTSLPRLREMTFNLATGEASSRQVADTVCDFPRVPLDLVGEQTYCSACPLAVHVRHEHAALCFWGTLDSDLPIICLQSKSSVNDSAIFSSSVKLVGHQYQLCRRAMAFKC